MTPKLQYFPNIHMTLTRILATETIPTPEIPNPTRARNKTTNSKNSKKIQIIYIIEIQIKTIEIQIKTININQNKNYYKNINHQQHGHGATKHYGTTIDNVTPYNEIYLHKPPPDFQLSLHTTNLKN